MPKRFIEEPTTHRVELEDGDWVEIREGILWEDVLDRFTQSGDVPESERRKRGMRQALQLGLVAWGGPGFSNAAGETLPLDDASIRKLDPATALDLINLVDKHNPRFGASGKIKASDGPASSSAAAGA